MEIRSRWTFECRPEHVWPHFLHARMDDTRPLLFRLDAPFRRRRLAARRALRRAPTPAFNPGNRADPQARSDP